MGQGLSLGGMYSHCTGVMRFRDKYMEGLIIWEPMCLSIMANVEALRHDDFMSLANDDKADNPRLCWDVACMSVMGEHCSCRRSYFLMTIR